MNAYGRGEKSYADADADELVLETVSQTRLLLQRLWW